MTRFATPSLSSLDHAAFPEHLRKAIADTPKIGLPHLQIIGGPTEIDSKRNLDNGTHERLWRVRAYLVRARETEGAIVLTSETDFKEGDTFDEVGMEFLTDLIVFIRYAIEQGVLDE
jgi:hypothetical protein